MVKLLTMLLLFLLLVLFLLDILWLVNRQQNMFIYDCSCQISFIPRKFKCKGCVNTAAGIRTNYMNLYLLGKCFFLLYIFYTLYIFHWKFIDNYIILDLAY